jgi:hypothetical protein
MLDAAAAIDGSCFSGVARALHSCYVPLALEDESLFFPQVDSLGDGRRQTCQVASQRQCLRFSWAAQGRIVFQLTNVGLQGSRVRRRKRWDVAAGVCVGGSFGQKAAQGLDISVRGRTCACCRVMSASRQRRHYGGNDN